MVLRQVKPRIVSSRLARPSRRDRSHLILGRFSPQCSIAPAALRRSAVLPQRRGVVAEASNDVGVLKVHVLRLGPVCLGMLSGPGSGGCLVRCPRELCLLRQLFGSFAKECRTAQLIVN